MYPLCLVDVQADTSLGDVHSQPTVQYGVGPSSVQHRMEQIVSVYLRVVVARVVSSAERVPLRPDAKDAMDGRSARTTVGAHEVVV